MALISHAQGWVRTIIDGLNRPFPWGAAHHSSGPDDVDVTPWPVSYTHLTLPTKA